MVAASTQLKSIDAFSSPQTRVLLNMLRKGHADVVACEMEGILREEKPPSQLGGSHGLSCEVERIGGTDALGSIACYLVSLHRRMCRAKLAGGAWSQRHEVSRGLSSEP